LLAALESSVRANMPGVALVTERIEPPAEINPVESNHRKFLAWAAFVERTPGRVVLLDADVIVNGDLAEAFGEWDAGITERTDAPMPLNGGVVFLNDTEGAREFMRRWLKWELEYYNNREEYREWYRRFCGPNQTALGLLLERDTEGLRIERLPCRIWNACEDDYQHAGESKAIHYKGRARRFAYNFVETRKIPDELKVVVEVWRKYAPR